MTLHDYMTIFMVLKTEQSTVDFIARLSVPTALISPTLGFGQTIDRVVKRSVESIPLVLDRQSWSDQGYRLVR
jgi:hypothetical protein